MKNYLLILLTITLACHSGISQINNKKTIEKFDEDKFKKLTIDPDYHLSSTNNIHYLSGNKKIRVLSDDKTIVVEESIKGTPYQSQKVYFTKNKQLKSSINTFYEVSYGGSREYDENGNLIKEINRDENFKFSINDLIKKMKAEYSINIAEADKIRTIDRYFLDQNTGKPVYNKITNKPVYEVYYKIERHVFDCFIINGNTGELMYRTTRGTGDGKGNLIDQYLKSLEVKK